LKFVKQSCNLFHPSKLARSVQNKS